MNHGSSTEALPRRRLVRATGLVAVLLVLAGGPRGGADEPARPPVRGEAVRLDGSVLTGRFETLSPEAIRWSDGTNESTLAPDTLREIRFEPPPTRPAPRVPHLRLTLTSGDRLIGTFASPSRDAVEIEHATAGTLSFPFEVVRSVEMLPAGGDPCFDAAATHRAGEGEDRVYTKTGDAYAGVVVETAREGIRIETARGAERTIAWAALAVAQFQVDPASAPAAAGGTFAEVETDDGSRFVAAAYPTGDATSISFALRGVPDAKVRIPLAAIRRIRTRSDRYAYASELAWTGRRIEYYGDEAPGNDLAERMSAPRADRRPNGCPLRVGGREYPRGFGVRSKTRIEIPLDARWKTFESGLAIDDEALVDDGLSVGDAPPRRGDVDARILGDDRVLWEAKGVKGGAAVRHLGPLDVSTVKRLVLEIDFGAEMNTRDEADWLEPVLVR